MKKKRWLIVSVIVILMLFLIMMGTIPNRIRRTDTVFDMSGQEQRISLDISVHKCISGVRLSGSILYNAEKYVHVKDVYGENWEGESNVFIIPRNYALDALDKVIILDIGDNRMNSYTILIKSTEGIKKYTFTQ